MELTLKKLAKEVEELKKRIDYLESTILTKEDIEAIQDFFKRREEKRLELLSIGNAIKELGIDEAEIREEISKETREAQ
jgi:uncharacterized protein YjiS (DUF1127 family)